MITGSCLCGAMQFGVTDFSSAIFKCHCSKCRKAFGGASSAAALVGLEHFSWLQGEEGVREFQCESGFKRRFCPDCGSILPQFLPDHQLYWIPVGLLDSDPGIPLKHHIHVDSKAGWEILDADTRRLGEGFGSA
ncbi:MAG: GFA family protein [Halioglobus sp.]|nr:GFA family protein [Halioglobus sp.]